MVKDEFDKKKIEIIGIKWYGGKWIVYMFLKVSFIIKEDEREIIEINGKKIDVFNYYFEFDLVDNCKDVNDKDKEFNGNFIGDKEKI